MRDAARVAASAALLALWLAGPARAVPVFTSEGGVRLSSASFQSTSNRPTGAVDYPIRVYYVSGSSQILSAVSADGLSFVTENVVRVSSLTVPALDIAISSITGCSVLPIQTGSQAGGFRMAYSVVGSTGSFRIYTATSADGLAWANETGTLVNLPNTFAGFPNLVNLGQPDWRLYYIQDSAGGNTPSNYRVFSALSTNEGRNVAAGSLALNQRAGQVAAMQRTDGKIRLLYTAPIAGQSSNTVILSALSTDANGTSFNLDAGVRASTTAPSALSSPMVARSTDAAVAYRWRLYYTVQDAYVGVDSETVLSAFTETPDPQSINPSVYFNGVANVPSTILGEIFAPAATAALQKSGQPNVNGGGVLVTNDNTMTATFNTQAAALGTWDVAVTDPNSGVTGTLANAVLIDFQGGSAVLTDNLIRPRSGAKTKIEVTIFTGGQLTIKVYTTTGRLVSTIVDGVFAAGQYDFFWDGTTGSGRTVASGVYAVEVKGPKLEAVNKIIVIK